MKISKDLRLFQALPNLYERVVGDLIRNLPRGGVMIDGGAHVGLHTAAMLERVDVSHVYAVEAIPELCDRLEKRFAGRPAVQIERCAIGNASGRNVSFQVAVEAPGYSGLKKREVPAVSQWQTIEVKLRTLDELVKDSDFCDIALIKLDLEGAEFDALKGARKLLERSRPIVVFENGLRSSATAYGYNWEEFDEFFSLLGYIVVDFFGNRVDRDYWDAVLQTYMFIATPVNSEINAWLDKSLPKYVTDLVEKADTI